MPSAAALRVGVDVAGLDEFAALIEVTRAALEAARRYDPFLVQELEARLFSLKRHARRKILTELRAELVRNGPRFVPGFLWRWWLGIVFDLAEARA